MGDDEGDKDRHERQHRLANAAEIEHDQEHDRCGRRPELQVLPLDGQEAEERVRAAGDRDRDRQHVVDEQRAAGDQADVRAEEVRGDEIAAAARGKELDDLRVARRDHENGHRGEDGQEQRKILMLPEREKRLLGPVAGGRETIGPETDPGEECDQRDVVEDAGIADVLRRPEQHLAEPAERTPAYRRRRRFLPSARIHRCGRLSVGDPWSNRRRAGWGRCGITGIICRRYIFSTRAKSRSRIHRSRCSRPRFAAL